MPGGGWGGGFNNTLKTSCLSQLGQFWGRKGWSSVTVCASYEGVVVCVFISMSGKRRFKGWVDWRESWQ